MSEFVHLSFEVEFSVAFWAATRDGTLAAWGFWPSAYLVHGNLHGRDADEGSREPKDATDRRTELLGLDGVWE